MKGFSSSLQFLHNVLLPFWRQHPCSVNKIGTAVGASDEQSRRNVVGFVVHLDFLAPSGTILEGVGLLHGGSFLSYCLHNIRIVLGFKSFHRISTDRDLFLLPAINTISLACTVSERQHARRVLNRHYRSCDKCIATYQIS